MELVGPIGRQRLPDANRDWSFGVEPLPEPQRAQPAVLVVDRGDAAGVRELDRPPHRLRVLVVGRLDVRIAEAPAGLLAQDAGRLATFVQLHDAAWNLQVAVRTGERGRIEPDRVRVARH